MKHVDEDDLYHYKMAYSVLKEMEANPSDFEIKPGSVGAILIVKNALANIIATNADI